MTRRVTVHFGLHKTGTSTAEATLRDNALSPVLANRIAIVGRKDWPEVSQLAKRYSGVRDPETRAMFGTVLAARLAALPDDGRDLMIANVDLAGRLPSHPDLGDYSAVAQIAGETARQIAALPDTGPVTFVASVRDSAPWLASLYWQSLKVLRETRDLETFSAAYAPVANFGPLLVEVAKAVTPAKLVIARLEDNAQTPLGPATPLLAAAGFAPDEVAGLVPHKRLKPSPASEVRDALLDLNRSALDDDDLADAKATLITLAGGAP